MAIIYRQFTHPQKMNREERKKTNDLYIFFCEINLRTKLLWVKYVNGQFRFGSTI